jgi:hypothetical protein
MALDYGALLFDPVYAEIGVPAVIGTAGITVIDDTRRKSLPISSAVTAASFAEVRSVGPGAFARVYELLAKGITRDVWVGAAIAFNDRTWTVRSYELHGSPNGEDMGEVLLLLKAQADDGDGNGDGGELSSSSVSSRSISGGAI